MTQDYVLLKYQTRVSKPYHLHDLCRLHMFQRRIAILVVSILINIRLKGKGLDMKIFDTELYRFLNIVCLKYR